MTEYLTRAFFEEELPALAEAFAREAGASKAHVELLLRDGVTIRLESGPTCTDSYVMFDYKSGVQLRRAVVPYGAIVGVSFSSENSGTLGFHR